MVWAVQEGEDEEDEAPLEDVKKIQGGWKEAVKLF